MNPVFQLSKHSIQFFIVAMLFLHVMSPAAFANGQNKAHGNVNVDSLDPTNDAYLQKFCAYHPASGLCYFTPNPPAPHPYVPPQGTDGGGDNIGSVPSNPPPPPAECKPATAPATVNPGTFRTALGSLGAGRTIVLAPGNYGSLNISGKSFGGATLQCAQPNACRFGNSNLNNVSGLTIDGIYIAGGNVGLSLKGTRDMTIRCSTFQEMEGTGILVVNNTGTLKLHNNTIYNKKLGCNTLKKSECGHKSDGSVLPYMDYGVRLHNVSNVEFLSNRLTGIFNHAISLKESVPSAVISHNIFESCGRACMEIGQEPSTTSKGERACGTALITDNTFSNVLRPEATVVVLVKNVHKVIYTGNRFNNVTVARVRVYNFTKVPAGPSGPNPGQLLHGGVPTDRTVSGGG